MPDERDEAERWFAANLKAVREDAGLSQETLAAAMRDAGFGSWKQQTVTKVENGARRVLLAEAQALARILRVPDEQLTGPPEATRDLLALREAMTKVERYRQESWYAAMMHTRSREELAALVAALREAGKSDALAGELAEADQALKGDR